MKNILIILCLFFLGSVSLKAQFSYDTRKIASELNLDDETLKKFYDTHKYFQSQYERSLALAETEADKEANFQKVKTGLDLSLRNILSESQYQTYTALVAKEEKE